MKLLDIVRDMDSIDSEKTIYALKPWTPDSEAIVALEPASGGVPLSAKDGKLSYFLEVFLAKEFLKSWHSSLQAEPDLGQNCERLIQYAINDA